VRRIETKKKKSEKKKKNFSLGYGFISDSDGPLDFLFLHVLQLLFQRRVFLLQLDVLEEPDINCVKYTYIYIHIYYCISAS